LYTNGNQYTKLAIRLESDKLPEPIDILHEAAEYAVL